MFTLNLGFSVNGNMPAEMEPIHRLMVPATVQSVEAIGDFPWHGQILAQEQPKGAYGR